MSTDPAPFAAQLRNEIPQAALRHVLGVFQTEIDSLSRALGETAAADDRVAFVNIAHRIAGSAGAVGARDLERSARHAMTAAKARPDAIAGMAAEIARLSAAARDEADALLRTMA